MSVRYWSIKGDPEGRHFCFTTEPFFECPNSRITYEVQNLATGEKTLTTRRPEERVGWTFTRHVSDEAAQAAQLLGVEPKKLLAILGNAHRHRAAERARVNGKLTNRCATCGAKMIDHGYSAYVERPKREDEYHEGDRTNAALAERMGFQPPMLRLVGTTGLKRSEARQWAYEQYELAQAALDEDREGAKA